MKILGRNAFLLILSTLLITCKTKDSGQHKEGLDKILYDYLNEHLGNFTHYQYVSIELSDTLKQYKLDELNDPALSTPIDSTTDTNRIKEIIDDHVRSPFIDSVFLIANRINHIPMSYSDFIWNSYHKSDFVKFNFHILKACMTMPSEEDFCDSIRQSLIYKEKPIGLIVLHKFRLQINGEDRLFSRIFYLDKENQVISMIKPNEY
jgi:hypothetical protein